MDAVRLSRLEKEIQSNFECKVAVLEVVADSIAVSRSADLTIFLGSDDRIYAFVRAQSRLALSDVRKMLSTAGLIISEFIPPLGRPNYFHEVALDHYQQVFPGRRLVSERDLDFYKTLVPYSPALAVVKQVKDGKVKTFDADVKGNWRVYCKFYYNKIDVK